MTFTVNLPVSVNLNYALTTQSQLRQDSQYKLWTIITSVAGTIFAGMGIAFQYLKALDAARTSNYMFGASVVLAIVTNAVYFGYILRQRSKENELLVTAATLKNVGASSDSGAKVE